MDNIKFDFKSILNAQILRNLENNSPETAKILAPFTRQGIDALTALTILHDLAVAIAELQNGRN